MNHADLRHVRPRTRRHLWQWVRGYTGVSIAHTPVCAGHSSPFDAFAQAVIERPDTALWHAPRGSGKSFLSGIDTHIQSRFQRRHRTRVLGGSKAQSAQVYEALQESILEGSGPLGTDRDTIAEALTETVRYRNGSEAKILAAGPKSVRGPHPQSLKLDEVDEIDPDIREAAVGMAMDKHGQPTSILMTSTWHKPDGPMAELIERGRGGAFPVHSWCIFEVLERCPDEISGPNLEMCPACPLVAWCHSDRDAHHHGQPKAKRSSGHYTVRSLIQKTKNVSPRVFRSDFLSLGPQVSGLWFGHFDETHNVTPLAEYDPRHPVEVSIDCGVHTGAVLGQLRQDKEKLWHLNIFGEHYSYDVGSAGAASLILALIAERCPDARRRVSIDSAGGAANPSGTTVLADYEIAGLRGDFGIEFWPKYPGSVLDGLNLIDSMVRSQAGTVRLTIHPRCERLIRAFQGYARKRLRGQFLEVPEDPQHPHEDLIDPVRGLLKLRLPDANRPAPEYHSHRHAGQFF